MKTLAILILTITAAATVAAQQNPGTIEPGAGAAPVSEGSSLPAEKVGPNDLLGLLVYDSPELSRPVRIDQDGAIRLPMVKGAIPVAGLYPADIEKVIAQALVANHVLVDPVVTVTVLEYRSHPITVMGAVRTPIVFQADGPVTLLDAISRAGGLADNAGSEILVNRPPAAGSGKSAPLTQRIPVQLLLNLSGAAADVKLEGGDVIRVPVAGQVFVLGTVRSPGAFYVPQGAQSSVLKALALSGGLGDHPSHIAYIYRSEGGAGGRNEIPIQLKKIMERKAPDVSLTANDILYIPSSRGGRISAQVLATSIGVAVALSTTLLYLYH